MPSLRCLISALTQAGGGDLLFRFVISVQSCCREGRALQTDIALCGEHSCVLATLGLPRTGVSVLSPSTLLRLPAGLYGAGPALSAVPVFGSSTTARNQLRLPVVSSPASAVQAAKGLHSFSQARCAFSLCSEQPRRPEARAASPQVWRAFSLCGPCARCRSGLRKSLDRNWGPVCSVRGGGFSGAEFAPFPSPLPPSSSGDGPALLCSFSIPLFCEPPVVCSGQLIFPCYPTV